MRPQDVGCDKPYYPSYYNYLGTGYGAVDGKTLCAWDKMVEDVNRKVSDVLKATGDNRIKVVDVASAVKRFDKEHFFSELKSLILDNQYALDNWPVGGYYPFFPHAGGGLFEGDNLHPSTSGHSIIADAVLMAINTIEGTRVQDVDLDVLYRRDPDGVFPPLSLITSVADIYRDFRMSQQNVVGISRASAPKKRMRTT